MQREERPIPEARPIGNDIPAEELRRLARRESYGGRVASRLLGLAHALEGMDRGEAAPLAGMDLQTLRDWVIRFNAEGVEGCATARRAGGRLGWTRGSWRACAPCPARSRPQARRCQLLAGRGLRRDVDLDVPVWHEGAKRFPPLPPTPCSLPRPRPRASQPDGSVERIRSSVAGRREAVLCATTRNYWTRGSQPTLSPDRDRGPSIRRRSK